MIFKISLATILLFFPIIIQCMNNEDEKLLEEFAKQQGVKELVNCMMDDINMRNEYSAVDHFHPNFRMERKDRPNDLPMDRHEYVDSLMNTGPHSLNMANMLAISHSGSMTFGFQSVNPKNEFFSTLNSRKDSRDRDVFVDGTMLSFGRDKKPYDFETTEEQEPSTSDRKMNPLIRGMEGLSISDDQQQGRKSNLLVRGSEGPSTSDGRRSKFWDFDPKAQKFSEYLDDRRKKERKERKEARLRQNAESEDSGRLDHVEGFLKSLEKGGGLG